MEFSNIIGLDVIKSDQIITIEENGLIDGSFCVVSVLNCLDRSKIAFVLHHHSFGHFQGIGTKLGYNFQALKDKGNLIVVDVMKKIFSDDVENILAHSYNQVLEFVRKNPNDKVTVILDHLGDISMAFGNHGFILNYVKMYARLKNEHPALNIIFTTTVLPFERPMTVLSNVLRRESNVTIIVRGLATGSAPDISGSITVKRLDFEDKLELTEYHYQLLDKKVCLFAPGTVQIR